MLANANCTRFGCLATLLVVAACSESRAAFSASGGTPGVAVEATAGQGGGAPSNGAQPSGGSLQGGAASSQGGKAGSGGVASDGAGAGGDGGSPDDVVSDPGTEGDGDYVIQPPYEGAPELIVPDDVPRGAVHSFSLPSGESAIYATDVASDQPFNRQVRVYLPNGYAGAESPFMVVQDGTSYDDRLLPVLDNLIHEGRLPKLVVVFVNPGPGDGPGSQRGLEYDTVSGTYVTFIETEILPKVAADYSVKFTDNPEGRASFGCSSGGAAAFTMGWFRPDLYRRILTYSGTFVNQAPDDEYPHGAWEYHENLIPNSEPKPLRVFLEVGENDLGASSGTSGYHNWVLANQRMAQALNAKGYHYRFIFAEEAGHCDGDVIAQTLPEALTWLWRGYPL
jgi:iron(III)-enterobactin esterase